MKTKPVGDQQTHHHNDGLLTPINFCQERLHLVLHSGLVFSELHFIDGVKYCTTADTPSDDLRQNGLQLRLVATTGCRLGIFYGCVGQVERPLTDILKLAIVHSTP